MRALTLIVTLLSPALALAHGGGRPEAAGWRGEIGLLVPLALAALWYLCGLARLRDRVASSDSPLWRNTALFTLGWLTLVGTLVSPLHALGRVSFTAHMTEHELLMLVAAPLLALSRPISVFLWAFPRGMRRALVTGSGWRPVRAIWNTLTDPFVATALQIAVLWIWHSPSLFDRALDSEGWHIVQHLSFLASALLFWWSITRSARGARHRAIAAFCLFVTSIATGALGALMAISTSPWYEGYAALGLRGLLAGGLTAAEDQQLAGLIMWIPGGLVHFVAALVFARQALVRPRAAVQAPEPCRA